MFLLVEVQKKNRKKTITFLVLVLSFRLSSSGRNLTVPLPYPRGERRNNKHTMAEVASRVGELEEQLATMRAQVRD